jgi:hypothetical protein
MLHSLFYLETALHVSGGTTTHQGHCATIRKVAGSIPDGVIGIFR